MKSRILVVDDEPYIRLTLSEALTPLGLDVLTAADGEAALRLLDEGGVAVVLLDLLLAGMAGMDVLRRVAEAHPESRVAILTAHGSVDNAVEAMKLGAVDFLQKPAGLEQVRGLVQRILDREALDADRVSGYESQIELAKKFIGSRDFPAAREAALRAVAFDSFRPEAHNLLGVLEEVAGHRVAAQERYRMALEADPAYRPAQQNLTRSAQPPGAGRGPMHW